MRVRRLFELDIERRRQSIADNLEQQGLRYEVQVFRTNGCKGVNFLVGEWKREDRPNIVITSHYDGPGAYDNAGGTIGLMWLTKWARIDGLRSFNGKFGLIVVFTDGEERGLLGAKEFLKENPSNVHAHVSIDGFGIGTVIGGFGNLRDIRLNIRSHEELLTLQADTLVFQRNGIPSIHLFSLPVRSFRLLVKNRTLPHQWRIIHTKEDTPDKIDEELIPFLAHSIYCKLPDLDFGRTGIFSLEGK